MSEKVTSFHAIYVQTLKEFIITILKSRLGLFKALQSITISPVKMFRELAILLPSITEISAACFTPKISIINTRCL